MNIFLLMILFMNLMVGLTGYRRLYRSRYLFSDRFGFTASMTASTILSLTLSINLFFLLPPSLVFIFILNICAGIFAGWLFGSMINAQSVIAGVFNGGTGAIMGTMVGVVIKNPAICSLPSEAFTEQDATIFFVLFSSILLFVTISLLCFALRV